MPCDNGKWKLWVWLTIPIQIESQSLKELRSARMFGPSVKCQARWGPNWNYIAKSVYDPVDLESIGFRILIMSRHMLKNIGNRGAINCRISILL